MHEILIERYKDENNRKKMSESCKKSLVFQNSRKNKEFRERHSEIMYERIKMENSWLNMSIIMKHLCHYQN